MTSPNSWRQFVSVALDDMLSLQFGGTYRFFRRNRSDPPPVCKWNTSDLSANWDSCLEPIIYNGVLYRDFRHWEKRCHRARKITIIFHVFEIANQLLTRHLLYLAAWMNGNTSSFLNLDKVGFFLLKRCLRNKQNNTWLLRDMEFLFSCSTRCLSSERSLLLVRHGNM